MQSIKLKQIFQMPMAILSILTASLVLSACAGVVLNDHLWCGSLATEGAACFHEQTPETKTMSLEDFVAWWDDLSDPKVATSSATLADFKADIEKLCSFEKICTVKMKQEVSSLSAKVDAINRAALKVKNQSIDAPPKRAQVRDKI